MRRGFQTDNGAAPFVILDPVAWPQSASALSRRVSDTVPVAVALSDIVIIEENSALLCSGKVTSDTPLDNPFLALCRNELATADTGRDGLEVTTVGDVVMLRVA